MKKILAGDFIALDMLLKAKDQVLSSWIEFNKRYGESPIQWDAVKAVDLPLLSHALTGEQAVGLAYDIDDALHHIRLGQNVVLEVNCDTGHTTVLCEEIAVVKRVLEAPGNDALIFKEGTIVAGSISEEKPEGVLTPANLGYFGVSIATFGIEAMVAAIRLTPPNGNIFKWLAKPWTASPVIGISKSKEFLSFVIFFTRLVNLLGAPLVRALAHRNPTQSVPIRDERSVYTVSKQINQDDITGSLGAKVPGSRVAPIILQGQDVFCLPMQFASASALSGLADIIASGDECRLKIGPKEVRNVDQLLVLQHDSHRLVLLQGGDDESLDRLAQSGRKKACRTIDTTLENTPQNETLLLTLFYKKLMKESKRYCVDMTKILAKIQPIHLFQYFSADFYLGENAIKNQSDTLIYNSRIEDALINTFLKLGNETKEINPDMFERYFIRQIKSEVAVILEDFKQGACAVNMRFLLADFILQSKESVDSIMYADEYDKHCILQNSLLNSGNFTQQVAGLTTLNPDSFELFNAIPKPETVAALKKKDPLVAHYGDEMAIKNIYATVDAHVAILKECQAKGVAAPTALFAFLDEKNTEGIPFYSSGKSSLKIMVIDLFKRRCEEAGVDLSNPAKEMVRDGLNKVSLAIGHQKKARIPEVPAASLEAVKILFDLMFMVGVQMAANDDPELKDDSAEMISSQTFPWLVFSVASTVSVVTVVLKHLIDEKMHNTTSVTVDAGSSGVTVRDISQDTTDAAFGGKSKHKPHRPQARWSGSHSQGTDAIESTGCVIDIENAHKVPALGTLLNAASTGVAQLNGNQLEVPFAPHIIAATGNCGVDTKLLAQCTEYSGLKCVATTTPFKPIQGGHPESTEDIKMNQLLLINMRPFMKQKWDNDLIKVFLTKLRVDFNGSRKLYFGIRIIKDLIAKVEEIYDTKAFYRLNIPTTGIVNKAFNDVLENKPALKRILSGSSET